MKKGIILSFLLIATCVSVISFTAAPADKAKSSLMPPDVVIEECEMTTSPFPSASQEGWAFTAKAMYILAGYNCVRDYHSTYDWGTPGDHAYEVCKKVYASNTPCP